MRYHRRILSTRVKYKIKSEKEFAKLVGKILAQDVIDEESGLVFGKASEKLTTAMLKRWWMQALM